MGPLGMSAKQHREYLKLQAQQQREAAKMEKDESRKQQLHEIKLQEAAAKANQGIGHKEDVHAAKLKELGSPLGKAPRMNKQKLGIPTQNPLAGTGVFKQGQRSLYAEGTEGVRSSSDTVPAMLTPGEAVIPEPAAQNPKNKPIIKAMVEEGRRKNRLRDGAVDVRYSDAPGQAKYHMGGTTKVVPSLAYEHPDVPGSSFVDGDVSIPSFNRGSAPQANYADGTYGVVPQQVQQAVGYFDGTAEVPEWDPNYNMNIQLPQFGEGIEVASSSNPLVQELIDKRRQKGIEQNARADAYNAVKDKAPVAVPVPGFNRMGNVAPVVPVNEYVKRVEVPGVQPTAGPVPSTNPNANQTAAYKPASDIEAIDPYTLFKGAESGNKNMAKNPLSSAAGPVQFTENTWNNIRKQVPELANVQYGSKEFYTDEAQRLAFDHTNQQNEALLNKNRIPITNVNRYVMHGLGAGDGARVLSNPQGDFRETLDQSSRKNNADLIIKQNPVYAKFKTNQDYIDWAESHLKRSAGIGRDSLTPRPIPVNPDPTQPEAVQVGTIPEENRGEPAVPVLDSGPVPLLESNPTGAQTAISDVAKAQHSNLDRLIEAIKQSNKPPEVKQQEAASLIEQVYGDKGIFNRGDLIRFALVAAGGMLTGSNAARSLRYAARDVLQQSDIRNRDRVAAERQDKIIEAQDKRQEKSLLTQAALQEVRDENTRANESAKNTRELLERLDSDYRTALGENVPASVRAQAVQLRASATNPNQIRAIIQLLKMNKATEDTMGTGRPTAPSKGFFDGKPIDFRTQAGNIQRINPRGEWENIPPADLRRFETEEARTKNTKQMIDSNVARLTPVLREAFGGDKKYNAEDNARRYAEAFALLKEDLGPNISATSFAKMSENTIRSAVEAAKANGTTLSEEGLRKAFFGNAVIETKMVANNKELYMAKDSKGKFTLPSAPYQTALGSALEIYKKQGIDLGEASNAIEKKFNSLPAETKKKFTQMSAGAPGSTPMLLWLQQTGGAN